MECRTLWDGVPVAFNSATLATKSRDEKRNVAAHDPPLGIPPRDLAFSGLSPVCAWAVLLPPIAWAGDRQPLEQRLEGHPNLNSQMGNTDANVLAALHCQV